MADIQIFRSEFPSTSDTVRCMKLDSDILFSVPDVRRPLGYKTTGSALAKLNDAQKLAITSADVASIDGISAWMPNSGKMNLVTEAGLTVLIARSDVPAAPQFREWVATELLPAIRRGDHEISTTTDKRESVMIAKSSKKVDIRRLEDRTVLCDHGRMKEVVSKTGKDEQGNPFVYYRCPEITGATRRGVQTVCGTWSPVKPAKADRARAASNRSGSMYLETPAGQIHGTPEELAQLLKAMG